MWRTMPRASFSIRSCFAAARLATASGLLSSFMPFDLGPHKAETAAAQCHTPQFSSQDSDLRVLRLHVCILQLRFLWRRADLVLAGSHQASLHHRKRCWLVSHTP